MRELRNTKEDFIKGVQARIDDGRWGVEEVEYLNEYRQKYHLNYDDIGLFLVQVYKYTYTMAMEDGVLSQLELDELNQIQQLSYTVPKNKFERDALKVKIMTLTKQYEKTNVVQESMDLENVYKKENEHRMELKNKVNNLYYRTPYPKLTPYTSYGY
jgi:hypothetical protein